MYKPHAPAQPSESLQGVLMNHIEYLPEVYRAHEKYSGLLQNDTCVLIYRYSSNMCTSCYLDDLMDLKDFFEGIEKNRVLILPAYPPNDRRGRMQINSETNGFRFRNITTDSLAFPISKSEGEKRYFAVVDTQGRIGMVFFPTSGRRDLTQRYFQEIVRFFPSNKDTKKDNDVTL